MTARRVGIGQPAMSNALSRLQPTGRALDLVEPVSRILAGLREEVLSIRAFDPATDQRTFRIGLSDQRRFGFIGGEGANGDGSVASKLSSCTITTGRGLPA